jgi:hypothetical protein
MKIMFMKILLKPPTGSLQKAYASNGKNLIIKLTFDYAISFP